MLVDETENKKIEKKEKNKQVGSSELCKFGLIFQTYNPVNCIPGLN
jgi:hypothetical protein